MNLYQQIIKASWRATWKYKYLWFFGIFATLLGNIGEYEVILRAVSGEIQSTIISGFKSYADTGIFSLHAVKNLGALFIDKPFSMFVLMFVMTVILALLAFLIWLSNVSLIAIVDHAAADFSGQKIDNADIQSGVAVGSKHFGRVFCLNLFAKIAISMLMALIGMPIALTAAGNNQSLSNLMFGLFFIIGIPAAMVISYITKYAIGYVVIKKRKIFEAIKESAKLFLNNWLVSIELAFLLVLATFVAMLVFIFFYFNLNFVLYYTYMFFAFAPAVSFWLQLLVRPLFILVVITFLWSYLTVFSTTAWTSLFIKLVTGGGESKLKRIFGR